MIYDCVVQCKRYAGRVSRTRLYEDILKAREHGPHYYILATTGIVGSSTKDWLNSQQGTLGFQLVLWERTDIDLLLERHQDLRAKYLGIPVEPDSLLRQIASESHALASADKILMTSLVRNCIRAAYDLAVKHSSLFTVGHLLSVLLRTDAKYTRRVFAAYAVVPSRLAAAIDTAFVKQDGERPAPQGLQLSASVHMVFETAFRAMHALRETMLSERLLLWALLMQQQSGTIRFLREDCRLNVDQLIEHLLAKFFTKREAAILSQRDHDGSTRRSSGEPTVRLRLGPRWS
jgi:hypothetical protein